VSRWFAITPPPDCRKFCGRVFGSTSGFGDRRFRSADHVSSSVLADARTDPAAGDLGATAEFSLT